MGKLTAMQELIEYVTELKSSDNFSFHKFIIKSEELLEKEKQDIIDTWDEAERIGLDRVFEDAEQYFEQTFKK